jgi:myo-inositol 2-dehydrogenase/D-chiro-inositol 1-dehydrogenase
MTLQLAFYGAGPMARPYLDALARRSDVTLAAVCDLDRRAAEQTAAGWGGRVVLSYEAMLEEVKPDALWVCVPPHLQGDVILRAAERRIPFFVSPPGAASYEQAKLYGQIAAEARIVTAVGFPGRYADVVREAREYLGANPIPLALGWWLCPPEDEPSSASALLWSDACRLVELLRLFCGEVTRVRALNAGGGATPGGLVVQLETSGGTVGVLTCATFARPEPRIELELLGEGWSLGLGKDLATLRLDERDKTTVLRCLNDPAADQSAAFLEAVQAGDPSAVTPSYAEALQIMAVCEAARLSAREGRPIARDEIAPTEQG